MQILICVNPAKVGGHSQLLDTWPLLKKIKRKDPELFEKLFSEARLHAFASGFELAPTFSLRQKHLTCIQAPFPLEEDTVGEAFQQWVDQEKMCEFKLKKNELVMADNARLLHGRSSFNDPDRHLIRILAWFNDPISSAPAPYAQRAKKYLLKLKKITKKENNWTKHYLGLVSETNNPVKSPSEEKQLKIAIKIYNKLRNNK